MVDRGNIFGSQICMEKYHETKNKIIKNYTLSNVGKEDLNYTIMRIGKNRRQNLILKDRQRAEIEDVSHFLRAQASYTKAHKANFTKPQFRLLSVILSTLFFSIIVCI